MLSQIEEFVNHIRRRNAQARTWRDHRGDLRQFATTVVGMAPFADKKVSFAPLPLRVFALNCSLITVH